MHNSAFYQLTPDAVLNCVERATGRRLVNLCRPHNSYINRVYEVQDEDGAFLVAKFFRPGRWSRDALLEELQFVTDCAEHELPVVPPLVLGDGGCLATFAGIHFAVYPRCGGRLIAEYSEDQWLLLGRLLGRVHQVGSLRQSVARNCLHPQQTTRQQADYLLERDLVPAGLRAGFALLVDELIALISPLFTTVENIRLHGDCHSGNLIYRPDESFYLIDFDDMVVGPAVQDLWMLLPGLLDDVGFELELLLEGYEVFRPFDRRSLFLIEPLRAMRYIHYISWCAKQFVEDGATRVNESFGSYSYWQKECAVLEDKIRLIRGQIDG